MHALSARRALTLIELVVALALSAVVGATALAAFLRLARAANDARRRDETRGAAGDAVRILRQAIERAPSESTRV
ncbi:MAG: prepilin-type N-terminal cleavage/methylation domain-containing protein, partial [Gemmatimonadaceae bacterium]|nr:prepilin-type N-terminal cleavage/methylation domain-containing protein [Gemmatimonadaceae bacterium]